MCCICPSSPRLADVRARSELQRKVHSCEHFEFVSLRQPGMALCRSASWRHRVPLETTFAHLAPAPRNETQFSVLVRRHVGGPTGACRRWCVATSATDPDASLAFSKTTWASAESRSAFWVDQRSPERPQLALRGRRLDGRSDGLNCGPSGANGRWLPFS